MDREAVPWVPRQGLVRVRGRSGLPGAGAGGAGAVGKIALLWEFADEIADSSSVTGDATSANIVITIVAGSFDTLGAQNSLTALTVNNVFGFNQVANGLNISSGSITGSDIGGGGSVSGSQGNSSEQCFWVCCHIKGFH